MVQSYKWNPDPSLWEKVVDLARQRGQAPEAIVDEAVQRYLEELKDRPEPSADPLVGLYEGSPNLSTDSEAILRDSANSKSGWTWKEDLP